MVVHAFPSTDALTLRPLTPDDIAATLQVFHDAVQTGAADHYSEAERNAWALSAMEPESWRRARLAQPTWVAEMQGRVIGFADLTEGDLVGMLYVHPSATRRGVGSALLQEVERHAREQDRTHLWAHVSLVAEAVFTRAGFVLMRREQVDRQGERLARAVMNKLLEPI